MDTNEPGMSARAWVRFGIPLGLALLLAGPGVVVVAGSTAGAPADAGVATGSAVELPYSLTLPWAERSGYSASAAASATNLSADSSNVAVTLTLWPSSNGLFAHPSAGHYLRGASAVADRYGLSADRYAQLEQYLVGNGLTVTHAWADRLALSVSGPAASVDRAFGTSLEDGISHGSAVRFPATVPALPEPYASEISAISGLTAGLTTFSLPLSRAPMPATASSRPAPLVLPHRTSKFVTPDDVHLIYGMDALYNATRNPSYANGVGIALVLWGEGYAPGDITTYFQSYYPSEFPAVKVAAYPVDGAPPPSAGAVNDPSGATQELTLDIEWAGSAAPGATLDAVYAPDGSMANNYSPSDPTMEDAINTAVNNIPGVQVVSMSFGTPDGGDPGFQAAFSTAFASAETQGITVLAASGDNGGMSKNACAGQPDPQFPASSPEVIAVGGTQPVLTLSTVGTVTGLDSEPAWNLSGGGFSKAYAAPSWQLVGSASAPIGATGQRGIPDVAGPAADNFFYFNGGPAAGKGTSFASPMWAGLVAVMDALRGQPFGFLTPRLYQIGAAEPSGQTAQALIDITGGANCLGSATTGWDTATGWGSPRALALYDALSFSFVQLVLTTNELSLTPGGTVQATVVVRNSTSHAPISGLLVTMDLNSVGQIGICTGNLATGNGTTDAQGAVNVTLGLPACYFGSHAQVAASVASNGYFGSNSTTLTVNLLGLAGFLAVVQVFPYNLLVFAILIGIASGIGWRLGRTRPRLVPMEGRVPRTRGPVGAASPTLAASTSGRANGSPPPPNGRPSPNGAARSTNGNGNRTARSPAEMAASTRAAAPTPNSSAGDSPVPAGVPAHVVNPPPVARVASGPERPLRFCSNCGSGNPDSFRSCAACGAPLT